MQGRLPERTTVKREFRLADVIKALKLPTGTRLAFSGREWEQPFEDCSVIVARLPEQSPRKYVGKTPGGRKLFLPHPFLERLK